MCLMLAVLLISGCSMISKDPPSLTSATLTNKVDEKTKAPGAAVTSFPAQTKQFFVSTLIKNPKKGTKVEARWQFDEQGQGNFTNVDTAEVSFDKESRQRYAAFSLTPTTSFPPGSYRVQIYLDGTLAKEIVFQVQ
jgi:hypothetical protein